MGLKPDSSGDASQLWDLSHGEPGKTTLGTTDPILKNLPQLDVADFYFRYPGIHANDA